MTNILFSNVNAKYWKQLCAKNQVKTALLFYLMHLIVYINLLLRNVTYFEQMRLIF